MVRLQKKLYLNEVALYIPVFIFKSPQERGKNFDLTCGAGSRIIVSNLVMNSEYFPKNRYLEPSSIRIK
jgi:hypothetical protein